MASEHNQTLLTNALSGGRRAQLKAMSIGTVEAVEARCWRRTRRSLFAWRCTVLCFFVCHLSFFASCYICISILIHMYLKIYFFVFICQCKYICTNVCMHVCARICVHFAPTLELSAAHALALFWLCFYSSRAADCADNGIK